MRVLLKLKNLLILPKNFNLIISAGSKLLFGKDAFIEIDGGTIQALGTDDKKFFFIQ